MPALDRGVFPELLTPFTLRAFGAFYLAIAIAVIPLLWARGSSTFLTHAYGSYALLVLITAAAAFFIEQFDFAARPTQAIYIGVYLAVAVVVGSYLVRYGTGATGKNPEAS
jgi:drug/metabolite transporter (DMT)-like permease